eukprot:6492105-Amphidinium_carterae.1
MHSTRQVQKLKAVRVCVLLAVWKQGKLAVHVPPEKRQKKVKPMGELLLDPVKIGTVLNDETALVDGNEGDPLNLKPWKG